MSMTSLHLLTKMMHKSMHDTQENGIYHPILPLFIIYMKLGFVIVIKM